VVAMHRKNCYGKNRKRGKPSGVGKKGNEKKKLNQKKKKIRKERLGEGHGKESGKGVTVKGRPIP